MKEPELEEEDLRAVVIDGRLEIARRSLGDQPKQVDVTTPSGEDEASRPHRRRQRPRHRRHPAAEEDGLYRVTDGTRTAFAASGDLNPVEMADLRSTETVLEPLVQPRAAACSGRVADGRPEVRRVPAGRRDPAGRGWMGLRANGRTTW